MKPSPDLDILLIGRDQGLCRLLEEAGFRVHRLSDGDDVYASIERHKPSVVLMREDSPSRDTLEHLAMLSRKYPQPALLLHDGHDQAFGHAALDMGISAYVCEGLSASAIRAMIDVTLAQHKRLEKLRRELSRSQKTLSERKRIDAAKCRLMEQDQLSEAEAYSLLKRSAMNCRMSLSDYARKILRLEGPA